MAEKPSFEKLKYRFMLRFTLFLKLIPAD